MINKKIASELAVGVILLVALAMGGIFWMENENSVISDQSLVIENPQTQNPINKEEKKDVVCTQEAKLCEDGSYVGRTGPNCEFAACPTSNLKIEHPNGWLKYDFKGDGYLKRPIEIFYPGDRKLIIEELEEKIVFQRNGKECWVIGPYIVDVQDPGPDFSVELKKIQIDDKEWDVLVWKLKEDIILYNFKTTENYSFSVNPKTLNECMFEYEKILGTFNFTD